MLISIMVEDLKIDSGGVRVKLNQLCDCFQVITFNAIK